MTDHVLLERHGAVARLTLNRPEKLNVLGADMISGLRAHLADLAAEAERVLAARDGRGSLRFQ